MTRFTLHNAPQSTCSQRVRYALHAKDLAFEEHRLDLFSGDQLRPEYLAINPNGLVPTLVDDGQAINDSAVILEYLDDVFPDIAPLRPRDPLATARMRAMVRYIDEVPTGALRVPSYNLAFLPHFQSMTPEAFQALCDSKPLRREFLMKMGRNGFPQADMDEALGRLSRGAGRISEWLAQSGGPWLMGEAITQADICAMPTFARMDDIGLGHLWDGFPAVQRWLDALRETPAYAPTYYHGSQLTEKYPHLAASKAARLKAGE
jgi:glutathione S-transferase